LVWAGVGDLFFEVVFVLCDTPEIPSRGQCASRFVLGGVGDLFFEVFFFGSETNYSIL
jgi:hypothetical protein